MAEGRVTTCGCGSLYAPWFKLPQRIADDHGYPVGWYRDCLMACGGRQITWLDPHDLEHHDEPEKVR